jgi:hypothetical protein
VRRIRDPSGWQSEHACRQLRFAAGVSARGAWHRCVGCCGHSVASLAAAPPRDRASGPGFRTVPSHPSTTRGRRMQLNGATRGDAMARRWEGRSSNRLAITWHVTANAAWPLSQEQDSSTLTRTPRPMCSRVTTTDGRSPGSRVVACSPPSQARKPSGVWRRLTAYSCGGSHGVGGPPAPYSLLISRRRTVAVTLVLFAKDCQLAVSRCR